MSELHDPTGHTIESYHVRGDTKSEGRIVEVDVHLQVPPVGVFAVNIVTGRRFADQIVDEVVHFPDSATTELFTEPPQSVPPYIVNDPEITDKVLQRVLTGPVGPDLAPSLQYQEPL